MPQSHIVAHRIHRRGGLFQRVFTALVRLKHRRAQRRALSRLDDHILRDIGLDTRAAARECAKPFWRD
jgi:uncharacterized protein YjiS (DUF1127 family)